RVLFRSPGTAATSISALRAGTTPPSALGVMAMVPPRPSTVTIGLFTVISCRCRAPILPRRLVDGHRPPPENRCAGPLRVRAGPANQQRNGDSAMSKVLIESVESGVCTLTMNRVERRNALSPELLSALVDAVARASADDAVGAIVLRGNGGYFCVGGDVKAMAEGSGRDLGFEGRVDALRARMEVSRLLHQSAKPTIAAITGAAAGAGLSIAMACDFRVAGRSAKLTTAFAKVGLSGDFGGTWFLTQLVGAARARELYMFSPVM